MVGCAVLQKWNWSLLETGRTTVSFEFLHFTVLKLALLWLLGWKNSISLFHRSYFRIYGETDNMLQASGAADKTFCLHIFSYDCVRDLLLRTELESCFIDNRFWSDAVLQHQHLDLLIVTEVRVGETFHFFKADLNWMCTWERGSSYYTKKFRLFFCCSDMWALIMYDKEFSKEDKCFPWAPCNLLKNCKKCHFNMQLVDLYTSQSFM